MSEKKSAFIKALVKLSHSKNSKEISRMTLPRRLSRKQRRKLRKLELRGMRINWDRFKEGSRLAAAWLGEICK